METLDNILENQDTKISETNQLLENVLENNDDNAKAGLKKQDEILKKVSEKPEVQKMELEGAEIVTIKGKDGDVGEKGERGEKGESIKGDKGDSIKGDKGESGEKGEKGEAIKGDKGLDGLDGKNGNDGQNGKDGKDADIKEVIKILEKRKISYKDLEDVPTLYKKGAGGGTGYLREITDIEVLTDPTDGQALVYDATKKKWKAGTVSGGSAGTVENLSAQCDGSNTVFTTTSNTGIIWLTLNGTMLIEGKEFTRDSATQITLTFAPATGEELYLKYI